VLLCGCLCLVLVRASGMVCVSARVHIRALSRAACSTLCTSAAAVQCCMLRQDRLLRTWLDKCGSHRGPLGTIGGCRIRHTRVELCAGPYECNVPEGL
jgi:hypothetical protein